MRGAHRPGFEELAEEALAEFRAECEHRPGMAALAALADSPDYRAALVSFCRELARARPWERGRVADKWFRRGLSGRLLAIAGRVAGLLPGGR